MDPVYTRDPDAPPRAVPTTRPSGRAGDMEHPLRPIVTAWLEKIKKAREHKKIQFGDDAAECMRFFNGPYDFMYGKKYASTSAGFRMEEGTDDFSLPAPTFQVTFNKVAEAVQLFGPSLYHKNPYRQANPRKLPEMPFGIASAIAQQNFQAQAQQPMQPGQAPPIDPMMMQQIEQQLQFTDQLDRAKDVARASLMEWYLNYTPQETNLKNEARLMVDEGLIKGMGVLWAGEVYQYPGSEQRIIGSFYDTVDNLQLDPDAEQLRDCKWIARRCTHPYWQVERDYGLPPESLKRYAHAESASAQGETNANPDGEIERRKGTTNDLLTYWKIWSKMGVGGRLTGIQNEMRETLEQFGDFSYIVVCEGCPYPLNLPPQAIDAAGGQEDILSRLEWPTPFWMDDSWPFAAFVPHPVPRQLWPMSHFKPAMGLLKFLNWAYSFIASKMRTTSRDFLAMKKSIGEGLTNKILHGQDMTLLEIEETHGPIDELIKFVQHPQMNMDVWRVIEALTDNFEKATGLSELMYGQSNVQMRSAQEASVKAGQLNVRPDDMASRMEDTMAEVAKLEAIAIRRHVMPQDVAPIAGQTFAFYWGQLVTAQDPYSMAHQIEYAIEAGSTRKPNKDRDQANMTQMMQNFGQMFYLYAGQSGNVTPFNTMMKDWGKANDKDTSGYMLSPPPPPPPPPEQAGEKKKGNSPQSGSPTPPQAA